jgi:hypothetical protein
MKPKVISVEAVENYLLELVFNDGTHRIFDVKPYLEKEILTSLKTQKYLQLPMFLWVRYNGKMN